MKNVLLYDAKYLLYRQFFAHKELAASGFPTGGMFGFWKEVIRMISLYPDWHMVFCWDGVGPSWRSKQDGYKGNRVVTPETIKVQQQEKVLRPLLQDMGFRSISVPGIEGDDLLALLSRAFENEKNQLLIYSADRDMYQLVRDPKVRVLCPRKVKQVGGKAPLDLIIDERMVQKLMGVPVKDVPELRALSGDPADNLKGLKGIGPKKAVKLLAMGARASKAWANLPPAVQAELGCKEEWPRIQREFLMVVLPTSVYFSNYTPIQQQQLKLTIDEVSRDPGRQMGNSIALRHRPWLEFLGKYEMSELFAVRNVVWQIP